MVWWFSYDPLGSSYPNAELVDGVPKLELVDPTRDGGVGLVGGQTFSGRRIKSETAPNVIRWKSRQKLSDFCGMIVKTVSDRLRTLIEEIEPGVHQFEPVEFIAKDGSHLEHRWFWQICNRLDSVHREKTDWVLKKGVIWSPPPDFNENPRHLVFDASKIACVHFWHDKHDSNSNYCSDEAHDRLETGSMTGFRYHYREQTQGGA